MQGRSREVTSIQECYDGKGFSRHSLDVRLWAVTWADAQGYGASGDTHTAGKQCGENSLSDPEEMVRQPQGDVRDFLVK